MLFTLTNLPSSVLYSIIDRLPITGTMKVLVMVEAQQVFKFGESVNTEVIITVIPTMSL